MSEYVQKSANHIPKDRLKGKVAIVTASTDGIGFAIAQRLAQEGAKVVISSRNHVNVEKALTKFVTKGLGHLVVGTVCHVSKEEDRKKIFEEAKKLGGLDILISNAGINPEIGHVLDCSEDGWNKIFDVNVKAAFMLAKEALPLLRERGSGRIIFMSSIAAYIPSVLLGAYSVTKTALIGLTKAIAIHLATENITVNCIAPGLINTKFSTILTQDKSALKEGLKMIPMKRMGEVDEVAGVAAFLASDDSEYITGETIVVAGGVPAHL